MRILLFLIFILIAAPLFAQTSEQSKFEKYETIILPDESTVLLPTPTYEIALRMRCSQTWLDMRDSCAKKLERMQELMRLVRQDIAKLAVLKDKRSRYELLDLIRANERLVEMYADSIERM